MGQRATTWRKLENNFMPSTSARRTKIMTLCSSPPIQKKPFRYMVFIYRSQFWDPQNILGKDKPSSVFLAFFLGDGPLIAKKLEKTFLGGQNDSSQWRQSFLKKSIQNWVYPTVSRHNQVLLEVGPITEGECGLCDSSFK